MSGETTYAGIASMIASVYELALFTAQEGNVVAPFVHQFNDTESSVTRIWGTYSGGTFATVAESADMPTQQAFNSSPAGTATPSVYAQMALLTTRRIKSDPAGATQDAGTYLGQTASATIDTDLVGLFGSLTGGTVGSAGGTLTWPNILRAQAYLRTNKIFGTYVCIMHPVQWYNLTSVTTGVPLLMLNGAIAESIYGGFYQGSFANIDFLVDANITSGTAATGAMFARDAMYLDMRQPFQINPQWNASYSGNGAWELNASMEFAYGVYRPTYGVQLIGTSA
jgi:hypothetical protein